VNPKIIKWQSWWYALLPCTSFQIFPRCTNHHASNQNRQFFYYWFPGLTRQWLPRLPSLSPLIPCFFFHRISFCCRLLEAINEFISFIALAEVTGWCIHASSKATSRKRASTATKGETFLLPVATILLSDLNWFKTVLNFITPSSRQNFFSACSTVDWLVLY
jgi:hypothetical protein